MITEEQKQRRKSGLFSSDIAAIMQGQGVRIALEKMGKVEPVDYDDVMEINIGWKAEKLVLDAYEKKVGTKLVRDLDTLYHPEYPWMGCHRDAVRPTVNVEAKTVGIYNRSDWGEGGDEVPDRVLWQVQEQMACSGDMVTEIPVCFVTALALKHMFLDEPPPITVFRVEKDFELEDYMIKKSANVWNCIQQGITPKPQNLNDIKLIYSKATDTEIEATEEIYLAWFELMKVRGEKKTAETKEEELKFQIQSYMETAKALVLTSNGTTLATWKNDADSEKFDEKQFAKDHPQIYATYLKNKDGVRKFLPKKPKK